VRRGAAHRSVMRQRGGKLAGIWDEVGGGFVPSVHSNERQTAKFLIPIVNSLDQRARSRIGPYIEREHYRSGRGARPPSTSRAVPPLRSGRTAPNGMMMARCG
jgi:hypothetical protein